MAEAYRKFGRTLRYEHGVFVRVEEAGEATEDGQLFSCHPIAHATDLPAIDESRVRKTVQDIESLIKPPLEIERLVVSEGVAAHEFGERRWHEEIGRVHLSIAFRTIRVILDFGSTSEVRGPGPEDLVSIAAALRRAGPERPAPARMTLAPNVTAALLPSLVSVAPPNIQLWQLAGGIDGKGSPVETAELRHAPWPNWYRPSYRSRPVRVPFHLRATCEVTEIEEGIPRAIALLAPPEGLVLTVLCVDGQDVYPARVHVNRIDAIAPAIHWYPYGAGSFGAEMML